MKSKNNRAVETIKTAELSNVTGGTKYEVMDKPLLGGNGSGVPKFG